MSTIGRILEQIHSQFRDYDGGALASYIPELTKADPNWFGITLVTADGHRYSVGDCDQAFTIQSISKAFGYGMALDRYGVDHVLTKIGVEPSGEAFNEISLETDTGRPFNPMINAGAIAATSMVPGKGVDERFESIRQCLSIYAGRDLEVDEEVYRSESATGFRNRAIAYLLRNSDIIEDPVEESVEVYFKQCSVLVTCNDLALMGATLANSGVNPITNKQAIQMENVDKLLSVMATCGMYDSTGEWIFRVGLPAKSGVGGGILGVLPGQMGLAVFSPLLDPKGNSERGLLAFGELSRPFNLHLFNLPTLSTQSIRNVYTLASVDSHRQRPREERLLLRKHGKRVVAVEMQGDLFFSSFEQALREAQFRHAEAQIFILDVARVGLIDTTCIKLLVEAAHDLVADHKEIYVVDPKKLMDPTKAPPSVHYFDTAQAALEKAERTLLEQLTSSTPEIQGLVPFHEFEIFEGLSGKELSLIESMLEMQSYREGELIVQQGSEPDYLYLLAKGSVAVYISVGEEKRERIQSISRGVSFGDIALIDKSKRSADIVSEDDSLCYQISAENFLSLEKKDPVLHGKILRNLFRLNLELLRMTSRELAALHNGLGQESE